MGEFKGQRGFTLIELMIALLIVSSLGLGLSSYLKRSSQSLRTSEQAADIERSSMLISRILSQDIRQVVYLNPSCLGNAANSDVSISCADIPVRGGIVPLPGLNLTAVSNLTNFESPPTLETPEGDLPSINDGLRLVLFDFDTNFDCPLLRSHPQNPDPLSERFFTADTCDAHIEVGSLYVIVQQHGPFSYSNLFQVTDKTLSGSELEINHTSGTSLFNQPGSFRNSGFTQNARIYPVYLAEYAVDETAEAGIFRREIRPDSTDLDGIDEWVAMDPLVESMQLSSLTTMVDGTNVFHNRSMNFTPDQGNNGLEDIRGIRPRLILKSTREADGDQFFSNPMVAGSLEDKFPRKDVQFFVSLQNIEF